MRSTYGDVTDWNVSGAIFYVHSTWGGDTSLSSTTDKADYHMDMPSSWGTGAGYSSLHSDDSNA
ncbi:MAG: hypothetical protein LBJ12_02865, partial [Oscillospiraceae bacterium]|nr:hypothetical protein [Oscillospiraceae bacterium]